MAALTRDRNTPERDGGTRRFGVGATKKILSGGMVALSGGYAQAATAAAGLVIVGRAEETVDNSGGANGAETVRSRRGIFRYANSAGADEITVQEIGSTCYAVDDQTVAKTDGTGTRSAAGTVFDIDADGVWVAFK